MQAAAGKGQGFCLTLPPILAGSLPRRLCSSLLQTEAVTACFGTVHDQPNCDHSICMGAYA